MTCKSITVIFQIKITTVENLLLLYFYLEVNGIITELQASKAVETPVYFSVTTVTKKNILLMPQEPLKRAHKHISEFDYKL